MQPAASAGAVFHVESMNGAFHGRDDRGRAGRHANDAVARSPLLDQSPLLVGLGQVGVASVVARAAGDDAGPERALEHRHVEALDGREPLDVGVDQVGEPAQVAAPGPPAPSAAHAGKAPAAAATARSTSRLAGRARPRPAALSSIGERSSNRSALATRARRSSGRARRRCPRRSSRHPRVTRYGPHLVAFHGRHAVVAIGGRRKAGRSPTCVERVARSALEDVGYLVAPLPLRHRLEVVDRVGEL